MARILFKSISIITFFFILFSGNDSVTGKLDAAQHGLGKEKLSHLHFYFHDTVSGPNATVALVASNPSPNKPVGIPFGDVFVIDDPLTNGPEINSKLVGRAQGIYAFASKDEAALLMNMNLVFSDGVYNGSNLCLQGRNLVSSEVREMPIVSGSGVFRFARGYALAKTHSLGRETAVVEYNVFVFHF